MLIPVGTNVDSVRRVPYVTFSLLLINILVCVYTSWMSDPGTVRLSNVRQEILRFSAYYPDAHGSADAQAVIREARTKNADWFDAFLHSDEVSVRGVPPLVARVQNGQLTADDAMLGLSKMLDQAEHQSFLWNYAFHTYRPTPVSLVSSTFLHEGALHLIGNMWFLYLAGAILEATWGYGVFLAFYLLGGIAALGGQAIAHPDSMQFVVGASGAVAACMGAFLVRFPRVRVKFVWILYVWFRGGTYRFSMPAFYVLPLWVALEVVYGAMGLDSIAHWAHVAGFVYGATVGFLIGKTGLEDWINREDESLTWHPDAEILEAASLMESREPAKAVVVLQNYLRRKPESIDGYETLLLAQRAAEDKAGVRDALGALCRLGLRSHRMADAWRLYGEWKAADGGPLPAAEWIDLCRYLEREKLYEAVLGECEWFVRSHPGEPQAFDAMLIAARVNLNKLKRVAEAERWFLMARESSFSRLEFEGAIQEGLRSCAKRMAEAES